MYLITMPSFLEIIVQRVRILKVRWLFRKYERIKLYSRSGATGANNLAGATWVDEGYPSLLLGGQFTKAEQDK